MGILINMLIAGEDILYNKKEVFDWTDVNLPENTYGKMVRETDRYIREEEK